MILYYLLIVLPFITAFFERKDKSKNKPIVVFFVIFVIMLSLRGISCGTDLKGYSLFFERLSYMSFQEVLNVTNRGETLYYLLNKVVSLISNNFQLFLTIVAFISVIPIFIYYKKHSENSLLTIALFVTVAPFPMYFSGLRQIIAMSVIIISFYFVKKNNLIMFILFIIVASLFHKSALIGLLIYPIYHMKITKKKFIVFIPLLVITFIYNKSIFSFFMQYAGDVYAERYNVIQSTGAYSIILLLVVFCIYSFVIPDEKNIGKDVIGLRNLLLFSTILQFFSAVNTNVMRLNYYYLLFIPILIPKIVSNSRTKYTQIASLSSFVMITFFIIYFFTNAYIGNDVLNIYPYVPFWKGGY